MKALGLSLIAAAVTLAPLVACGGGGSNSDGTDVTVPDAKVTPDAPVTPDAFVLPAGCDYYEQNDTGNDAITTSGNTEQSQFSLAATTTTFCGQINSGHFVAPVAPATYGLVDYDVIQFTVAANTQAFVTLTGTGIDDTLPLSFFVGGGADKTAAADGVYDTRVMRATGADLFPAGDYVYVVGASAMAAITANHEYRLKITTETNPNCETTVTPTASFTEASDGANNTGNDVLTFLRSANAPTLTAAADAPELTAHTATTTSLLKIAGVSAANAATTPPTFYWDGDTYEFTTGATVDQARIRLNWTAAATPADNADLDFYVYEKPAAATLGDFAFSGASDNTAKFGTADEFSIGALKPSTTYWVHVGGYRGAMGTTLHATPAIDHLPQNYSLQICGDKFIP